MAAFAAGYVLDLILGDPHRAPHPVRLIGRMISACETWNRPDAAPAVRRRNGRRMTILVCSVSAAVAFLILSLGYSLSLWTGGVLEAWMTYRMLAARSLWKESMKVYDALEHRTLEEARRAVSMIVGRDTGHLSQTQVAKAAVETVAENASDGVIAPMLCFALGGPTLGFFYKAVNTMDSMVGYKNETFLDFGRAAAKLDDAVNFLPSRISAFLMIAACAFLGKEYDGRRAYRIFRRDRFKHASPNSAQTESACAGALGIRLAGDASYFGQIVHKSFIGDDTRPAENRDIIRANHLMMTAALLCELICLLMMGILWNLPV